MKSPCAPRMGGVNLKNEPVTFSYADTPDVPAQEMPVSVGWWSQTWQTVACWLSRITGWFR